jgi:lactate permease
LLANTAPVAFGGLGIPIIALHGVTGLDTLMLTRVGATLVTPFCILVPFRLIWAYAGFKSMIEVWPAILVSGGQLRLEPIGCSATAWALAGGY